MSLGLALDWLYLQRKKETEERRWQASLRGVKLAEPAPAQHDRAQALMTARQFGAKIERIKVSKTEMARRRAALGARTRIEN